MHHVEHRHEYAMISFVSEVSEQSIIELVHQVTDLRYNHFYRKVHLQIATPGGDTHALFFFLDALRNWQRDGLNVTTRALTSCSSAGAILLSLGHTREASPSSSILYHDARYPNVQSLTRRGAESALGSLGQIDDIVLSALANRAVVNHVTDSLGQALTSEDLKVLKFIRSTFREEQSDTGWDEFRWICEWLKKTKEAGTRTSRSARWKGLYDALFLHDGAISGTFAYMLGLVDRLLEPGWFSQDATQIRHDNTIRIPEWSSLHTDGRVILNQLRRHTLILGETGSGKSASAVIPVVAAAYHSNDVASALVIDPKRELLKVLEEMEDASCRNEEVVAEEKGARRKKIVPLRPDELALDLMGGSWSITQLVSDERYRSAAEKILSRTAGLIPTPARVLLNQPGTHTDVFWDMEATKLVSAVMAIAIECTNPESPILLSDRPEGLLWQLFHGHHDLKVHVGQRTVAINALRDVGRMLGNATIGAETQKQIDQAIEQGRRAKEYEDGRNVSERNDSNLPDYDSNMARRTILVRLLDALTEPMTSTDHATSKSIDEVDLRCTDFLYQLTWTEARSIFKFEMSSNRYENTRLSPEDIYEPLPKPEDFPPLDSPEYADIHDEVVEPTTRRHDLPFFSSDMVIVPDRSLVYDWLVEVVHSLVVAPPGETDRTLEGLMREFDQVWRDEEKEGNQHSFHALVFLWQLNASNIWISDAGFRSIIASIEAAIPTRRTSSAKDKVVPNIFSACRLLLDALCGPELARVDDNDQDVSALTLVAKVWKNRRGAELRNTGNDLAGFATTRASAIRQYTGVFPTGLNIVNPFANEDVNRTLYFGCEGPAGSPGSGPGRRYLNFSKSVAKRGLSDYPGEIFVYQPLISDQTNLIGKACKALYFDAILGDEERTREGTKMRLVGYIADEFQRFITADRMHGEQSFLDTCRSFGAFAVMATQSMAGLEYALCDFEKDVDKRRSALKIILNNTGTKIFFRSTDQDTAELVSHICPEGRDGRKVVGFRPLSTLSVGECYASLPDGRFERVQLSAFEAVLDDLPPRVGSN